MVFEYILGLHSRHLHYMLTLLTSHHANCDWNQPFI